MSGKRVRRLFCRCLIEQCFCVGLQVLQYKRKTGEMEEENLALSQQVLTQPRITIQFPWQCL